MARTYQTCDPTDPHHREALRAALRQGNRIRDGVHNPDPNDERYKYGHNSSGNNPNARNAHLIMPGRRALEAPSGRSLMGGGLSGLSSRMGDMTIGGSSRVPQSGLLDGRSSRSRHSNMMQASRQGPNLSMTGNESFRPLSGSTSRMGGGSSMYGNPMSRASRQGPSIGGSMGPMGHGMGGMGGTSFRPLDGRSQGPGYSMAYGGQGPPGLMRGAGLGSTGIGSGMGRRRRDSMY